MCVLTHDEILKEINGGRIGIDPFDEEMVGPGSVDLHLAGEIRVFVPKNGLYHVTDEPDIDRMTETKRVEEFFVLEPGETIHGLTRERIRLPPDICGWLEGRSRFARLGLMIHVTAGFIQPGIDNHQVLELSNTSREPLAIRPGIRICQFIFERTEGHAVYNGRFRDQTRV
ncbi:MAG: dCTP deaminase [Myxococcota bacterium]